MRAGSASRSSQSRTCATTWGKTGSNEALTRRCTTACVRSQRSSSQPVVAWLAWGQRTVLRNTACGPWPSQLSMPLKLRSFKNCQSVAI